MSKQREEMPDVTLDWLTCIVCVKHAQLRDADGWVMLERSVAEGDRSDDAVYKCPEHATASDEWEAKQRWERVVRAVADDDE